MQSTLDDGSAAGRRSRELAAGDRRECGDLASLEATEALEHENSGKPLIVRSGSELLPAQRPWQVTLILSSVMTTLLLVGVLAFVFIDIGEPANRMRVWPERRAQSTSKDGFAKLLHCSVGGDTVDAKLAVVATLPPPPFALLTSIRSNVKTNSGLSAIQEIASWGDGNGKRVEFRLTAEGNLEYGEFVNSWNQVHAMPRVNLVDGKWHKVAVVRNNWGLVQLYVDGALVAKGLLPASLPDDITNTESHTPSFDGAVADFRVYGGTPSSAQILVLGDASCGGAGKATRAVMSNASAVVTTRNHEFSNAVKGIESSNNAKSPHECDTWGQLLLSTKPLMPGEANEIEFRCKTGKCILVSGKCNGHDDCGDGSDEQSCDAVSRNMRFLQHPSATLARPMG